MTLPSSAPAAVPALLSIYPETARILGLSRGAAYRAAARGDLPLMALGKLKKVITSKLSEQIGRPIVLSDIG